MHKTDVALFTAIRKPSETADHAFEKIFPVRTADIRMASAIWTLNDCSLVASHRV
jgi:hypothetical protein